MKYWRAVVIYLYHIVFVFLLFLSPSWVYKNNVIIVVSNIFKFLIFLIFLNLKLFRYYQIFILLLNRNFILNVKQGIKLIVITCIIYLELLLHNLCDLSFLKLEFNRPIHCVMYFISPCKLLDFACYFL